MWTDTLTTSLVWKRQTVIRGLINQLIMQSNHISRQAKRRNRGGTERTEGRWGQKKIQRSSMKTSIINRKRQVIADSDR